MCSAVTHAAQIQIQQFEENNSRLFKLENAYYEAVFAPEQAMFPLYYRHKPSGKDMLVRKASVAESFRSRDGIQLCLPWVGDTLASRKLPSKGLLPGAAWQADLRQDGNAAVLEAQAAIAYADPTAAAITNQLLCKVVVSGTAQSSCLRFDFSIANTGANPARFMFVAHARIAPDGAYLDGDYIFTPAKKCWVSDFQWPALSAAGVSPHSWTDWPIAGADRFTIKSGAEKRGDFVYAFIPAEWLMVGNDRSKNFVLFHASPIAIGKEIIQPTPYYCILRRDNDYLVEVAVSRELDAKYWDQPEAALVLPAGAKLEYTLHLAAGQGLAADDVQHIERIHPHQIEWRDASGVIQKLPL